MENMDLQDLIDSEQYVYSVSNIEDKRDNYTPGNTVQIMFPSGNYIKDCKQDYLIFDSTVSGAGSVIGACYPRQPEDFFSVNNLEINGVQLMQSTLSQGKNLFTNWLKNSLTPYKPEQYSFPITSLYNSKGTGAIINFGGCVNTAGDNAPVVADIQAQVLSYEPIHLVYSGQTASGGGNSVVANASHILAYNQAQISAAKWRQKQYNISVDIETGIVSSAAPATANEFSVNMIRLGDICPEYDSLGVVNMCNTQIRITLRFNDANRVLTCGLVGTSLKDADLVSLVLGDKTYSLSNLCLYSKILQIKPNLIAQAKMLMNSPKQIMTVYQNIKPLEGPVTNQRISLNTSNIYYVVVFLQPNSNNKTSTITGAIGGVANSQFAINYSANSDTAGNALNFDGHFNNLRFGTYDDSIEFKYDTLQCDIGGKQFKTGIIPVGTRSLKAWIDANNAVYQCTGQYLNITLNQFLNNRFFAIIPISPNQYPNTILQDSSLTINILLNLAAEDRRFNIATKMQMVTFVVGSKTLLDNCTRLE